MKYPGDMAKARRIHKSLQRTYDDVKRLRTLKEGETITMRLHGENVCVMRTADLFSGTRGRVVYVRNGRVCFGEKYKDAPYMTDGNYNNRCVKDVLGVVVESEKR